MRSDRRRQQESRLARSALCSHAGHCSHGIVNLGLRTARESMVWLIGRGGKLLRRRQLLPIDRLAELQARSGLGHRIFEPGGAVEEDRALAGADPPIRHRCLVGGIGCRASGQRRSPLRPPPRATPGRSPRHRRRSRTRRFPRTARRMRKSPTACGTLNAGGEGVCVGPARGVLDTFLPGLDHRCAARCLDHDHARALFAPIQPIASNSAKAFHMR